MLEASLKKKLCKLNPSDVLEVVILPKESTMLGELTKYLDGLGVKKYESVGGSVFANITVNQVYDLAKQNFVSYLSQETKSNIEDILD